jgi:hypothetical protein
MKVFLGNPTVEANQPVFALTVAALKRGVVTRPKKAD